MHPENSLLRALREFGLKASEMLRCFEAKIIADGQE
jgi:hypothetical protein